MLKSIFVLSAWVMCFSGACRVDGYYYAPDAVEPISGSWLKHIHGSGSESAGGVALSPDGSVYVAGVFEQTIDLGGGPLVAAGADMFVAKFGSNGQHVWSKHYNGNLTSVVGLLMLSDGDLIVAGEYLGSLNFDGVTLSSVGGQDVFIARLSAKGDVIWIRSGGGGVYDQIWDVSVDSEGNVVACGGSYGAISLFGGPTLGSAYVWLARMSRAGEYSWSRVMSTDPFALESACGVAALPDGDVVFAGNFKGSLSAGGAILTSVNNSWDMYLVRYAAADGSHLWSMSKGGSGDDRVQDVEVLNSSIYIAGSFKDSISFGGSFLTGQGVDAFMAKFDAVNGSHLLSVSMGGADSDHGDHLAVRADGQVTVSGTFIGVANFGGTLLTPAPGNIGGQFVADLDGKSGAIPSVKSITADIWDVDTSAQALVVGGSFSDSVTILGQKLLSDGLSDGYLAVFKR